MAAAKKSVRTGTGKGKPSAAPGSRTYLFLGPETGEKDDALAEIRARMGGASGVEETSFYAGETPANDICSVILNGSLFSGSRLFVIKNAENIRKNDAAAIAGVAGNLEAGTVLVLVSGETKVDAQLEKAVDPKNRRIFWELFEDRKAEWVRNFFRREGFRISDDGVDTVLELVENNTAALRQECARLCLFVDKNSVIDAGDAERWLAHSREESAFTLFSRIAAGDLSRSVETLHSLLASKETPQSVFAGLAWSYRRFRDYIAIDSDPSADDAAFRRGGFTSPRARKDFAALSRRTKNAGAALALIAEFDLLLRGTGSGAESFLMDLLVYKLVCTPEKNREEWRQY